MSLSFIVNRHPNELWGKAKKEPQWHFELGPSGQPTGRIYNSRGQRMERVGSKWKTVKL